MSNYVYPARITPAEEGGWLIRFRDFPEGHSQAEVDHDVIDFAEGCLQACIEGRLEDAMAIPEPSAPKAGEVLVTVPIETATKAALFQTVAASGTSRVALAKAVNLDEKEIRRMLDPRHSSKLPRIEQVLKALGKQLRITLVDAVQAPRAPVSGKSEARQGRAAYRVGRSGTAARKIVRNK